VCLVQLPGLLCYRIIVLLLLNKINDDDDDDDTVPYVVRVTRQSNG